MSNILLLSDLHLEFDGQKSWQKLPALQQKIADIVVLAGDIGVGYQALDLIDKLIKLEYQVVYVLGNHEFFGYNTEELIDSWHKLAADRPGLAFLHNSTATINGIHFWGSPLWSNLATDSVNAPIPAWFKPSLKRVADFRKTPDWQPESMLKAHYKARHSLHEFLTNVQHKSHQKVVVSHFLPSMNCIPEAFFGHPNNPYFATSNLDSLIKLHGPNLWLHGHTHLSVDKMIGRTRIICNPRGYLDYAEVNPEFAGQLITEM